MIGYVMSSRLDTHIQASFFTLHCDIFHLDIISSLFSDITYHHLWYSFSDFSFIIAYSTLSLFHFEWLFLTRHCMEDCHVLPLIRLISSGSKILFWEVVLLGRIHVASVHEESLFIWLCISCEIIHYWSEYAQKKIKIIIKIIKNGALFILLFSIGHVYGCASLLHWVHVLERVRMRASFLRSILVYFGWGYESPIRFLWERRTTFL